MWSEVPEAEQCGRKVNVNESQRTCLTGCAPIRLYSYRGFQRALLLCAVAAALVPCAQAKRTLAQKKQLAQAQFETAQKMREALNGQPGRERRRRDYNRVSEAFRKVYSICPNFRQADESIVDTAELLAETGRAFHDPQASQDAIAQYQFLMQQYPGSVHNTAAMFTIGKIYQEDLEQNDKAKASFEEFLKHHPMHRLSDDARQALDDIAHPQLAAARNKKKSRETQKETKTEREAGAETARAHETQNAKLKPVEAELHPDDNSRKGKLPLVTGIRHWSTPDYTRIAIDREKLLRSQNLQVNGKQGPAPSAANNTQKNSCAPKPSQQETAAAEQTPTTVNPTAKPAVTPPPVLHSRSSNMIAALFPPTKPVIQRPPAQLSDLPQPEKKTAVTTTQKSPAKNSNVPRNDPATSLAM